MDTNITTATPAVQPAGRPQPAEDRATTRKDGTGAATGFAPRTNVNIKNSVNSMVGVLSRIASDTEETEAALPKQLQKIVDAIMKSSFSVQSSIGDGVGSALSSGKFSMEQMQILNRLIEQMAMLSSRGQTTEMSDELGAFLSNLKNVLDSAGAPNGAILNKLAFQIISGEEGVEIELPKELQQILAQLSGAMMASGAVQGGDQQSEFMNFMKQLVDAFFPKSLFQGNSETAGQQMPQQGMQGEQNAQQAQQGTQGNANMQQAQQGSQGNANMQQAQQGSQGNANMQQAQQGSQGNANMQQAQQGSQGNANMQQTQQGNQGNANMQQAQQSNQGNANMQQAQQGTQGNQGVPQGQPGMQNAAQGQTGLQGQTANAGGQTSNAQQGTQSQFQGSNPSHGESNSLDDNPLFKGVFRNQGRGDMIGSLKAILANANMARHANKLSVANQPPIFQNTPQNMEVMKDLAQLLLRNSSLSQKDAQLLQNFVNGNQGNLSQQDAKQLNLLLRMVQTNVPVALQQAGQQQGMENLPRLWAFMQLCDMATLKDLKMKDLRNTSKQLVRFLSGMKGSMQSNGAYQADGQKSISFMMPLYLGENDKSYPTYVHVYDEEPQQKQGGKKKEKETWLRMCILTDNIGAVEITCRLYEGKNINLRILFSENSIAKDFQEYIPELRTSVRESDLQLKELKLGSFLSDESDEMA